MTKSENKNESENKKPKKNKILLIIAAVIIGIIIIFLAVNIIIVRGDSHSNTIQSYSKIVPLPIATVGSTPILLSEYFTNYNTIENYGDSLKGYASEEELQNISPDNPNVRASILSQLIENEIIKKIALEYDISLSDSQINEELEKLSEEGSSIEQTSEQIEKIYGISIEEFKHYVLSPALLFSEIRKDFNDNPDKYNASTSKNNEIKKQAEDTLASLKEGKDFAETAIELSDDKGSAQNGGDLGFIGRGETVTNFEEAAFNTPVGEYSEIVETEYGYHIIRVEEKNEEEDKVRARHILFATEDDFSNWLENKKKEEKVTIYRSEFTWNNESGSVEIK